MIHLLRTKPTSQQVEEMLHQYESMIKIVVDIHRRVLAGGSEMQSDYESLLLEDGSQQDDLWGANWYPGEQEIVFEALICIRPRAGNNVWLRAWDTASQYKEQRVLLSVQAKDWSDRTLEYSGLG